MTLDLSYLSDVSRVLRHVQRLPDREFAGGGMDLTRPKLLALMRDSFSTRQEMVQDLLAVVDISSGRLPGLRRFGQGLKADDLVGGPA